MIFVVKQKAAYEMSISDWSSDVCSSGLKAAPKKHHHKRENNAQRQHPGMGHAGNPGFQQHEHGRSEQRPKKITGAAQYGHQYGLGRHGPMHKFRAGYTQERRHQSARQTRKSARQRKRRQAIAAHVQSAERDELWVLAYGAQDQAERRKEDQVQTGNG